MAELHNEISILFVFDAAQSSRFSRFMSLLQPVTSTEEGRGPVPASLASDAQPVMN